jgi:hypothetical protein
LSATGQRIIDMLERRGRNLVLRRRVGTTTTFREVSPRGYWRGYKPQELVGGITQGDQEVVIGNAEIAAESWPGPPKRGDIVVLDGLQATVQAATPMYDSAAVIAHILWVRG